MRLKNKIKVGLKNIKKGRGHKKVTKKSKKRIIKTPKLGGFLPLLLPILGALGALGGGATGIAKAVNDAKANKQQLEEQKRQPCTRSSRERTIS